MKEMKFSFASLALIALSFIMLITGIFDIIRIVNLKALFPYLFVNRFLDLPSFLIVIGGILTNAFIIYPHKMVLKALSYLPRIFSHSAHTQQKLAGEIDEIVQWANQFKTDRTRFLNEIDEKYKGEFPAYVFSLVSTNYPVDDVIVIGNNHIDEHQLQYHKTSEVFKNMGNSGPAFGMFGTLFGLVYMLSSLDDPSKIGPGLAVGLLVTLYGVSLTHLFFYPLSKKIILNAEFERLYESIVLEGAKLMLENKSPLYIKDKLLSNLDRKFAQHEQSKSE